MNKFYHASNPEKIYTLVYTGTHFEVQWEESGEFHHIPYPKLLIEKLVKDGIWIALDEDDEEEERNEEVENAASAFANKVGGAIASDGGSSSYYDIRLPDWLIDRILERADNDDAYIKTEELIQVAFDNDFDAGNAFKSLVRLWGAFNGAGKAGNSVSYEKRKIEYSVDKLEQRFERLRNEVGTAW